MNQTSNNHRPNGRLACRLFDAATDATGAAAEGMDSRPLVANSLLLSHARDLSFAMPAALINVVVREFALLFMLWVITRPIVRPALVTHFPMPKS